MLAARVGKFPPTGMMGFFQFVMECRSLCIRSFCFALNFILFFGDFFVDGDNVPVFRPFVSPRKMRHNKSAGSFILSLVCCVDHVNNDLLSPTTCSITRRIFIAPRRGRRKKNIFWQRFSQPSRVSMEMNDINNPLVDKQFFFFQRRK